MKKPVSESTLISSHQPPSKFYLPRTTNILMLVVWSAAAVGIVLPFALGTSPLNALLLHVPNNEGNWWHVLVGLPFLLSLPMIWLRLQLLNSKEISFPLTQRLIWMMIIVSALGTLLVETPFLLHRAGTSELQRLEVIFLGIGMILINFILLYARRNKIHWVKACMIGLISAYLANAILCLIVYGESKFENTSRSGWYLTIVIAVPMLIELIWLWSDNKTHSDSSPQL